MDYYNKMASRLRKALCDGIPVHHVPPSGDVVGALVLIFQIVGVLPDIETEQGCAGVIHEGVILVRRAGDGELAVFLHEPGPARAEATDAGFGEGFFEGIEGTEGSIDGIGQSTGRSAASIGGHAVPEEGVIPVTAAVVAHGRGDVSGDFADVFAKVIDAHGFEIGLACEGVVQIGDVSVVMTAMMNFHRRGINVRFERGFFVGKGRQGVGHNFVGWFIR